MALSKRNLIRKNIKYINRFLYLKFSWTLLHLIKPNEFNSLITQEICKKRMEKKFQTIIDYDNPEPFISRWGVRIYVNNPVKRSRIKMFYSGIRMIREEDMNGTHEEYMAAYLLRGGEDG